MKHKMFLFAVVVFISTANLFSQLSLEVVWEKPSSDIIDAKFSPDGKFIYCAIGADIKKLDVQTGEFVATFDRGGLTGKNLSLDISQDGKTIITGYFGTKGGLCLWDTEQQKFLRELKIEGMTDNQQLYLSSFSPDNKHLILTLYTTHQYPQKPTNEILFFDLLENKVLKTIPYNRIAQLTYSKDGKYFITGTAYEENPKITLWDAQKIEVIKEYKDLGFTDDGLNKLKISDNNKLIGFSANIPNIIVKIIERETGEIVATNKFGTAGGNFDLLQNDYFIIYEAASFDDYGLSVYRYPNMFQSRLNNIGGDVLISFEKYSEDENKFYVFVTNPLFRYLMTKSTSNSIVNHVKPFTVKVDRDKITVNFDGAESIKIIDMIGNTLYDMKVNEPVISIPNIYPAGNYLCVVKSQNKEYTQKFQVVR